MPRLWDAIKSLFEKLNNDDAKLFRIELLAIFIAFVLLLMSILDSFRNRSRNPLLKYLLLAIDAIAGSLVTYTVGVMQSAPLNNDLIQVWGVLLTILYDSSSGFSAHSLQEEDVYTRRRREVNDLMNVLFVANLNATHETMFIVLLWVLWGANTLKLLHRILAMEFAARSYGLGLNSRLVADYMHYEHELTDSEDPDPTTMRGYKYLVLGEEDQEVGVRLPGHLLDLKVTRKDKLVTLDKVWECPGKLLNPTPGGPDTLKHHADELKDVCLSYALFKLLRRRFDDERLEIAEAKLEKTRNLVFRGLLCDGTDYKRAIRVIGMELAFMSDYLHTRHPLIFSCGLPLFNLALFVIIAGAGCWLVVLLICCYQPPDESVFHEILGKNVDVGITIVVLVVIIVKETWEIATYLFSVWAKVALVGKYVRWHSCQTSFLVHICLGYLCKFSLMKHWHGKIHQYSLLRYYRYEPWCWKHLSKAWRLMTNNAKEGGKEAIRIPLSDQVKEAVINSLRSVLINGHVELTNGLRSLQRNNVSYGLHWACRLETQTHTVLVWHIATTLCEISLGQRTNLSPVGGCLLRTCCKPPAFDVDIEKLQGELKSNYMVATSLSRYCAYLLVFVPDLLPDGSFTSDYIFKKTVYQLRSYLHDCDRRSNCDRRSSMQSIYEKMMDIGEDDENDIVAKGARLGKQLIEATENEERCWKVLADFWAEMILFLAPSSNANEHAMCLATGGEFLSLIWALLTHAGILEPTKSPPESI